MVYNKAPLINRIAFTFFIILLVVNSTTATSSNLNLQRKDLEREKSSLTHRYHFGHRVVQIFTDKYDPISSDLSKSIYQSLTLFTHEVSLINISSTLEIQNSLIEYPDAIAIYIFPTEVNRIVTHTNEKVKMAFPWSRLTYMMNQFPTTKHILSLGNTKSLQELGKELGDNIYYTGDEAVDSQQLFIFTMWTLADILENDPGFQRKNLGKDIRMATLQFFGDNFNSLVKTTIEPENAMGINNPKTILKNKEEYITNHEGNATRLVNPGYSFDEDKNRVVDSTTGQVSQDYVMDIFPSSSTTTSDVHLDFLPTSTGLRGPIGGIIDTMLPYLIQTIGDSIGLSMSTVDNIASVLTQIPDMIGLLSNPSSSKLHKFIDSIKPMLPIPEDMMQYFDIILDAIFLLKGDTQSIETFLRNNIPMLLPDGYSINGVPLDQILFDLFDLGTSLTAEISSGGDITTFLVENFNVNMMLNLSRNFMTSLGVNQASVENTINIVGGILGMVTTLVSTNSIDGLLTKFGTLLPQMLIPIYGDVGLTPDRINILMGAIGMILVATGVVEGPSIEDLLSQLLTAMTGYTISDVKSYTDELMNQINRALKADVTSVSDFKQFYLAPVLDAMIDLGIITPQISDAIDQTLSLVMATLSQSFTLNGAQNVSTMVLSFLNAFDVVDNSTINAMMDIFDYVMVAANLIFHPPNIGKILSGIYSDLKSMFYDLLSFAINIVTPGTITVTSALPNLDSGLGGQYGDINGDANLNLMTLAEGISLLTQLIKSTGENSIETLLFTILQSTVFVTSLVLGVDLQPYVDMVKNIFGSVIGIMSEPPSLTDLLTMVLSQIPVEYQDMVKGILGLVYSVYSIFTGGYKTVLAKLTEWLTSQASVMIQDLTSQISSYLDAETWKLAEFPVPIGIGDFSLFTVNIVIGLEPGFDFNEDKFAELLMDLVFRSTSIFGNQIDSTEILHKALTFLNIFPVLSASFELTDFSSASNSFFQHMMDNFGLEMTISGSGSFELSVLSYQNGVFNKAKFFSILGWSFRFEITISKTLTLLDFLTAGAGSTLNDIGDYIGLDAIKIDIWFSLAVDIIKRAASASNPETSTLNLVITFGFALTIDIDIVIATLNFVGSLEIMFTLSQDLASPVPMEVFLSIVLTVDVHIGFLFWDWDFHFVWWPNGYGPSKPYSQATSSPEEAVASGAIGGDSDNDGLSDTYENTTAGLDFMKADSDGDGLSDKMEIQMLGTNPANSDSDGDGVPDNEELTQNTDPNNPDSDFDQISDFDEINIYGTNPLSFDTDEDGLDDYYEVHHIYNMTGITPTVTSVVIGGVTYSDHTDPLNPDTDGDGLLDGEEDIRGIYYGPSLLNFTLNSQNPNAEASNAIGQLIIFNGGYTHPLDADTDDDSYLQNLDGSIASPRVFLMDMSDFEEIHGISTIFFDQGQPQAPVTVRTNPVSPDSDRDTPSSSGYLLSDGYELSRTPPQDPLDGDTDNDGLMDGLEGMFLASSNHTDPTNGDTDGDGLGDLQEIQLGSNPRSADTDNDGITDYDEFFVFGTNIFLADTDSDNIVDGDEVWFYNTNPFVQDTDHDGISDYQEIYLDTSNPVEQDSDHDFLSDFDELFVYHTDPWVADTDGDGLVDGEEVLGLPYFKNGIEYRIFTDPNNWDSDQDSLTAIDQNGDMSMSLSDAEEYQLGLDPTSPDTDMDGIPDAWELWLGKGLILNLDPINLNPKSNDTDGDGIFDGLELIIANFSTLLNPYIAYYLVFPFDSQPDLADSDGDLLIDSVELSLGTSPASNDTDKDHISDWDEVNLYLTDPSKNDTDGDSLLDALEIFGYDPLNLSIGLRFDASRVITTDATKSDTDGDLLPDGAEVLFYGKDPNNPDQNQNSILDGLEIDTDFDGLSDGDEFYTYHTAETNQGGGILKPDSDRDGLFDGYEVFTLGTFPNNWDSDNDSYPDGLEVSCGLDPLDNSTTIEDLSSCFKGNVTLHAISPMDGGTYTTADIPVLAYSPSPDLVSVSVSYRYENHTQWSVSENLVRADNLGDGFWRSTSNFSFGSIEGQVELQLNATLKNGTQFTANSTFSVKMPQAIENYFSLSYPFSGTQFAFMEDETVTIPLVVKTGSSIDQVSADIVRGNTTVLANISLAYEDSVQGFYGEIDLQSANASYSAKVTGYSLNGEMIADEVDFTVIILSYVFDNGTTTTVTSSVVNGTSTISNSTQNSESDGGGGGSTALLGVAATTLALGVVLGASRKQIFALVRRK